MIGDKSFFTSLKDFNGGNVTFGDGSVARVKGRSGISIPRCQNLDGVLYVDKLKVNLLSISQICDSDYRVNFSQILCETINKERKVIFTRHRIMDNCYAINPSSKTSLVCSRAKLDVTELWHRKLGHINNGDLVHIANKDLIRGIPKLSGQPKSICGECMKGKQVKNSHKKIQGNNTLDS